VNSVQGLMFYSLLTKSEPNIRAQYSAIFFKGFCCGFSADTLKTDFSGNLSEKQNEEIINT
jgi:hypothetical protein